MLARSTQLDVSIIYRNQIETRYYNVYRMFPEPSLRAKWEAKSGIEEG